MLEECILLCTRNKKFLDLDMVSYLHVAVSTFLVERPGQYKISEASITYSDNVLPSPDKIPNLMKEFIFELQAKWEYAENNLAYYSLFDVAAFALWRLNWIHPFEDANGRVSRAVCYILICADFRRSLNGSPILPEIIAQYDDEYRNLLREADKSFENGQLDLTKLRDFIGECLLMQIWPTQETEHII